MMAKVSLAEDLAAAWKTSAEWVWANWMWSTSSFFDAECHSATLAESSDE